MLSLIIKIKHIYQCEDTDRVYIMLLSEQARGHHVGDPWFRFSMLLASVVQPDELLSCIRVTLQATDE